MSAHYVGQVAPNYIHSTMQANSDDDSFTFTVGKLDAGMAILIGEKASLIEFPSLLLPNGVSSGSVVNIRVMRNEQQEQRQKNDFDQLQEDILHTFGQQSPKAPNLRLRNVTQTSVTLEWDRLSLATAGLLSLDIYRNGQRLAPIPNPLHNTSTKLSGLDVNAEYTFHLVLKTTAGTLSSPVIKTRTHTINDTSGISVCFGHIHDPELLQAAKTALANMKARFSDKIQIDTTHYVCTDPRNPHDPNAPQGSHGPGYSKAMQLSIPAVLPHWIFACHDQKKMVGISPFYLDQDPPNASSVRESVQSILGKSASSSGGSGPGAAGATGAATADQVASTSASAASPPPPPLEKSPKTLVAKDLAAEAEEHDDDQHTDPAAAAAAPLSAEEAADAGNSESAAAAAAAEATSTSALGLDLSGQESEHESGSSNTAAAAMSTTTTTTTTTASAPPIPIITTSAPEEDVYIAVETVKSSTVADDGGADEQRQKKAEEEVEVEEEGGVDSSYPTAQPQPQPQTPTLIITPSEETDVNHTPTVTVDDDDDAGQEGQLIGIDDDDGEMDDVSLGGGTDHIDVDVDEADSRLV
ncbi:hypothetical protein BCV70DRAFT_201116 [Testicularia cyperi]|uniref:BRCT domain-containing protein n=1 Tax=Testicularia cyperi TaxID=1882483 RepID=A0A317XNU0_9BASI|nr:hypothetical protein BCV70DRAFT_201116 [Testicularia cyperi]